MMVLIIKITRGPVAELVDAHDLKSCVLGRAGSSPAGATISFLRIE